MDLVEMARQLKKEAVSEELQYLRDCRAFLEAHSYQKVCDAWERIKAFGESPEGQGMDGRRRLVRMIAEANRTGRRRTLYTEILKFAERAERREKGGGAALIARHWEEVQKAEAGIDAMYEEEGQYQLTLLAVSERSEKDILAAAETCER